MSEEIEVILREILFNDITYDYDVYKDALISDIKESDSFMLSFLLDKCLYYGVSPIFMYLLSSKLKEKDLELIFEIVILYKNNLITDDQFVEYFDYICSFKKSLSEVCKIVLQDLKFVFTRKSMKKNALFASKEFLFKFRPLPLLDSGSLLTKEPSSIKIQPSTLVRSEYDISQLTVKLCLSELKNSSSRIIIYSTLNRILKLYNSEIKIKEIINSLDYNVLTLNDFYEIIDTLLSELESKVILEGSFN